MNTQVHTPTVAIAKNISAMPLPTGKTVVRAAKGELVLFAGYDPTVLTRTSYDDEAVDLMGSFAVSH